MTQTPVLNILRDFSSGEIRFHNLGPLQALPGSSLLVEEVLLSDREFRENAWSLVEQSLETYPERAIAERPKKPPEEVRRAQRRHRQLERRYTALAVSRESSVSLLLHLRKSKGKRGYWEEVARATIPIPASNDEFLQALEDLGFFSHSLDL